MSHASLFAALVAVIVLRVGGGLSEELNGLVCVAEHRGERREPTIGGRGLGEATETASCAGAETAKTTAGAYLFRWHCTASCGYGWYAVQ